jgi:hypothetical protein
MRAAQLLYTRVAQCQAATAGLRSLKDVRVPRETGDDKRVEKGRWIDRDCWSYKRRRT